MKPVASLRGVVEAQSPLHTIGPKLEQAGGVFFIAGGRAAVVDVESASSETAGVGVKRES